MPNLDSLLYQFVIGGLIFFVGIFVALRSQDYSWKNKNDRILLVSLILGFFIYLLLQTIWYLYGLGKF